MLQRLLSGKRARTQDALALYDIAVAHARSEAFYRNGTADTPEGRFEIIALHIILLIRRGVAEGEGAKPFNQTLFDVMFDDMDAGLRELGVGDTSVPKRIKKMSEAFYGRAKAYGEAIAADDPVALAAALRRNVALSEGANLPGWSAYVLACEAHLAALSFADITKTPGQITLFPKPDLA